VREVMAGLGADEAWTPTMLAPEDHRRIGLDGPAVTVTNPLSREEDQLRQAQLPGLLRALAYNADRRQGDVRFFEVGTVFSHPGLAARPAERAGAGGSSSAVLPAEREMLSVVLAGQGDDARTAVTAWHALAGALRLQPLSLRPLAGRRPGSPAEAEEVPGGLHPTRTATLVVPGTGLGVGTVGEVDPAVLAAFGLDPSRRVGWLEVDLGLLLDPDQVPRRPEEARPVSRFPSSDVDLALVVADDVPAEEVAAALAASGGDLLESIELFDVYRGPSVPAGHRSLAYRLRYCADDHTLTDAEVGEARQRAIDAARALGAELR
jgi:phenylalanyl-tRNA synthetase beta chain